MGVLLDDEVVGLSPHPTHQAVEEHDGNGPEDQRQRDRHKRCHDLGWALVRLILDADLALLRFLHRASDCLRVRPKGGREPAKKKREIVGEVPSGE